MIRVSQWILTITTPLIVVLCLAPARAAGDRLGFLLDGKTAPKEGNISLRGPGGEWYVVQGIPISPPPLRENSTTIAIIDSGVMRDHPQLRGLVAEERDFTGEGPRDRIGHGTVVAILTRGFPDQIPAELRDAPPPRMIVAKVAHADGTIDKRDVVSAIQWAVQRGARLVNLSLGFREGSGDYSEMCLVIAQSSKVMFFAAAGNFGPTVRVYPAACQAKNLMSVGTKDSWSGPGDVIAPGTIVIGPQGTK